MKSIFETLSNDARLYFEAHRQLKSYRRNDVIYRMGEKPTGLYSIKTGLVGLVYHSPRGTDHLLRVFRRGQFFAHRSYFANEVHHATSIALEPTEVEYIGHGDLEVIIDMDSRFLRQVVEFLAKELRSAELQRVMMSEQDVLARTAHAVAVMKDFDPKHKWTRAEIASFCGSTTPTVVRALAQLEEKGLIQQVGREIQVLDRDRLLQFENHG